MKNEKCPEVIKNQFQKIFDEEEKSRKVMSYLPSALVIASLPLRDTGKPLFQRKFNGITLSLTGSPKVPSGNYARLIVSILTTHAVISKENEVVLHFQNFKDLTDEMKIEKQRSKQILAQLELLSKSTFIYEEKIRKKVQGNFFDEDEPDDYTVTKYQSGKIAFIKNLSYGAVEKKSTKQVKAEMEIVLDRDFVEYCREHAVPIDYTVYSSLSSALAKDLYAWIIYKNRSLGSDGIYLTRKNLVEQFLPVLQDNKNPEVQERTNFNLIKTRIEEIKEKYYPDLRVFFDQNGMTFEKSNAVIRSNDKRYMLVTSDF